MDARTSSKTIENSFPYILRYIAYFNQKKIMRTSNYFKAGHKGTGNMVAIANADMRSHFINVDIGTYIDSRENFDSFVDNDIFLTDVKVIFVFEKINWYNREYRGLALAADLRRSYLYRNLIVVVSFEPIEYLEGVESRDSCENILCSRGTLCLQLNELTEHQSSIEAASLELSKFPISDALMRDMNSMLLDQKGCIDQYLLHDLRHDKIKGDKIKLERSLDLCSRYLTRDQLELVKWKDFSRQLLNLLSDQVEYGKILDAKAAEVERLVAGPVTKNRREERKYSVLAVEDDLDFHEELKLHLSNRFERFTIVSNSKEAIAIIDSDDTNSINGVLCDWRLYEADLKTWQLQGYEILDYTARNHFSALFALTSLTDQNVHDIRNELGLNFQLFKKEYLRHEVQWDLVADIMYLECEKIAHVLASLPTGAAWKQYKNEYLVARQYDWLSFENEITQKANNLFHYYQSAIESDDYRERIFDIEQQGYSLSRLADILVVRRVFLGIFFSLILSGKQLQSFSINDLGGFDAKDTIRKQHLFDTCSILRKDWWDTTLTEKPSDEIKAFQKFEMMKKNLMNSLCITLKDLPSRGVLPEEVAWLHRYNIHFANLSFGDPED